MNPTFNNFEILIINDGSGDNTVEVEQSSQKDSRVKLTQANQGVVIQMKT